MTTNDNLADALDCFWNAALDGTRRYDDATANAVMSGMVQGVAAVATRLRELDAASLAAPPAQGEWVMVPREPTEAMLNAAFCAVEFNSDIKAQGFSSGNAARTAIYAAMLAAAPQPAPAPVQVDDGWQRMTQAARDMQARHLDNHQGDVYHAMQSLVGKFGAPRTGPMIQDRSAQPPAPAPVQVDEDCGCCTETTWAGGFEAIEQVQCAKHAQPPASGEAELLQMVATNIRSNLGSLPSIASDWADKIDAAIAALAQQRVPDAVRELPVKWRAISHGKVCNDAGLGIVSALAQCARELESALATIDQQQEGRNGQ